MPDAPAPDGSDITDETRDSRARVRSIPGATPVTDPSTLPFPGDDDTDAGAIFLAWLDRAVRDGIAEPQSAVLSTVHTDGGPDARVVTLKDVSGGRWWVSGRADSPKGEQLDITGRAALTFYWSGHGRQVRVRGHVGVGDDAVRRRDFVERSVTARAVASASAQSEVLTDPVRYDEAVAQRRAVIDADETFVDDRWRAWWIAGDTVEFWQADPGRRHRRRRYVSVGENVWTGDELWP